MKTFLHQLFAPSYLVVPETLFWKHCYITGSAGSGKSVLLKLLLLQGVSRHRGSCSYVLIDKHGDAARQCAAHQIISGKGAAADVFLFDLTLDPTGKRFPRINPLDVSDTSPAAVNFYAEALAKAIQTIIGDVTKNMTVALKIMLKVLLPMEQTTLADILLFLDSSTNTHLLAEAGRRLTNPIDRAFFAPSGGFHEDNLNPSKNALKTSIQALLGNDLFYRVTCDRRGSTVNLTDLLENRKIALLALPNSDLGPDGSNALGKLLLSMITAIGDLRNCRPESQRPPTRLFIDEFQNFLSESSSSDAAEHILTELRKSRIYCSLATQIPGQKMSREFFRALLSNTNVKIIGKNAPSSLRSFTEELGLEVDDLRSLSTGRFCFYANQWEAGHDPEPPRIFQVPSSFVGFRGSTSPEAYRAFVENQLSSYYRADEEHQADPYSPRTAPDRSTKFRKPKSAEE